MDQGMIVSKGWFSCLGTTAAGRAFVVTAHCRPQSPLFLLVSAKNTDSGLRILRNSKQYWLSTVTT